MHVPVLRLLWVLFALWFELGVFVGSSRICNWPTVPNSNGEQQTQTSARILIIADPQILDAHSYPGRAHSLVMLSQYIVDLFMRKSWRNIQHLQPDIIIFLGDMMDNGRIEYGPEYEAYYSRFKRIFRSRPSIPVYFVPGNHDTGLGSIRVAHDVKHRYIAHFGPMNQQVTIANHTLVLVDAPGLVDEDYQRTAKKVDYNTWKPKTGGTVEYVQNYHPTRGNTILFTHIPLSRRDGSPCGPHRERGTIRRGVGIGYQNTLGSHASNLLLERLKPSIVFSGDDHDMCEHKHTFITSERKTLNIPEVTVKSFSMAMGIRRPGFHLLTLASPHSVSSGDNTFAERMCLLPDQLGIYLNGYVPFLVISLIVVAVFNWRRVRRRNSNRTLSYLESQASDSESTGKSRLTLRDTKLRALSIRRWLPRRLFGSSHRRKSASFWGGFLLDVRDIAIFPLSVFICITFWAFWD